MMASLNLEVFNMVASKAFNQRYEVTKDFTPLMRQLGKLGFNSGWS